MTTPLSKSMKRSNKIECFLYIIYKRIRLWQNKQTLSYLITHRPILSHGIFYPSEFHEPRAHGIHRSLWRYYEGEAAHRRHER